MRCSAISGAEMKAHSLPPPSRRPRSCRTSGQRVLMPSPRGRSTVESASSSDVLPCDWSPTTTMRAVEACAASLLRPCRRMAMSSRRPRARGSVELEQRAHMLLEATQQRGGRHERLLGLAAATVAAEPLLDEVSHAERRGRRLSSRRSGSARGGGHDGNRRAEAPRRGRSGRGGGARSAHAAAASDRAERSRADAEADGNSRHRRPKAQHGAFEKN